MMNQSVVNMDTQRERIELHCHSKFSGNATMYSGEIIQFASNRNMPAIAITDRDNILGFPEIQAVTKKGKYFARPIYGMEILVNDNGVVYAYTVLVRNDTGKEELYRIVSENMGGVPYPVFEKELLFKNREGLLIGSGAEHGKLRRLAHGGVPDEELTDCIRELDYVELLPFECDKQINTRIFALAEREGKTVVAVSDAHFLEKQDRAAWNAVNRRMPEPMAHHGVHLLSTEEMLEAFSYLPKATARKIVVDNTYLIADLCGDIKVLADEKSYPVIAGVGEKLRDLCFEALKTKYPANKQKEAEAALRAELVALREQNMAFYPLLIKDLLNKAGLRDCDISMRGVGAGSIVVYLLGISDVDPIKHHLIPEMIYGKDGRREIDIDINVPEEMKAGVCELLGTLPGIGKVLPVGTQSELSGYIAEEMADIKSYVETCEISEEEKERIIGKIAGNFMGWRMHPCSVFLFPSDYDHSAVMPVQKLQSGAEMSYFAGYCFYGSFLKIDIIGLNFLDALRSLSITTGVDLADVPTCCPEVLELFKAGADGRVRGCLDLPMVKSDYVVGIIEKLRPESFDDIVDILGIAKGSDTWIVNSAVLQENRSLKIKDLISHREDVYEYLLLHGVDKGSAFDISEGVRKGYGYGRIVKWLPLKKKMVEAGIPEWYITACEGIKYLYPRAHSISYANTLMRLGWFKVHYPKEYSAVVTEYGL